MNNQTLSNQNDIFDLAEFLLSEIYGPMQVDGQHIQWTMQDSIDLSIDLKHDGIDDSDPQEIYELMMEFDAQDNED